MVALERLNERLRLNLDDQARDRRRQDHSGVTTAAADEGADPLQKLKDHLVELQNKFTEKHPDVIRTKAQIAELERQRAAERRVPRPVVSAPAADPELDSLKSEESALRSEIAACELRIQGAPRVEQELEGLQREYNSAKDTYDSIQKRYEEAQLADSLEQTKRTESFRILDSAIVPSFPAAPNRKRLLLIAAFLAIAGAIGMMLLAEHVDSSFHTVGELRQFTTLPVLGSIPYVSSRLTFLTVARVAVAFIGVIVMCVLLAGFAYRAAHENTALVWMLSGPQI